MELSDFKKLTIPSSVTPILAKYLKTSSPKKDFKEVDGESQSLAESMSVLGCELELLDQSSHAAEDLTINIPFVATNNSELLIVVGATSHFWKLIDVEKPEDVRSVAFDDLIASDFRFAAIRELEGDEDFSFKPFGQWLTASLFKYRKFYRDVILASIVVNLVAMIIPLFSMNVYDKVVPNTAFDTLWVLASVIFVGLIYDWVLKVARAKITDRVGQEVDKELSLKLMERVLRSRAEQKPQSIGSFSKSFQDFDSVRDFMMSATSTTLVDLPFALLFLLVVGAIGGWIVVVPIVAMIAMLALAFYSQHKMKGIIEKQFEVKAKRSGSVFEALQMSDLLKTSNAIPWMLKRWRSDVEECADSSYTTNSFTVRVTSTTQFIMQMVSICTVIVGVYLISDGLLTMGGLIASMMLSSRAVQYVMAFSTILTRFQQARAGIESVDQLLAVEPERGAHQTIVSRKKLAGEIQLQEVSFLYPNTQQAVLKDVNISIQPGEKIALIGNMGSGKSTLISMLSGLYLPTEGRLLYDNLDANHWDTDMLRAHIGTVTQAPALIKGSIFQNITLGLDNIDDEDVIDAIRDCGLDNAISRFEGGLDYCIGEGNRGVSGGQAQTISLARAIVKNASLLIFDEPTSMLDKESEARFLRYLSRLDSNTTVIVSSHSPAVLQLFDRAIVLDKGKVRFDGPTYKLLQTGKKPASSATRGKDHVA